MAFRFTMMH
jgi:hypothetical protein